MYRSFFMKEEKKKGKRAYVVCTNMCGTWWSGVWWGPAPKVLLLLPVPPRPYPLNTQQQKRKTLVGCVCVVKEIHLYTHISPPRTVMLSHPPRTVNSRLVSVTQLCKNGIFLPQCRRDALLFIFTVEIHQVKKKVPLSLSLLTYFSIVQNEENTLYSIDVNLSKYPLMNMFLHKQ